MKFVQEADEERQGRRLHSQIAPRSSLWVAMQAACGAEATRAIA